MSRRLDAYTLWRIDTASSLRFIGNNLLRQKQVEDAFFPEADGAGNDLRMNTVYPPYTTLRLVYERKL